MASKRAILNDIEKFGLNPRRAYTTVGGSGHLRPRGQSSTPPSFDSVNSVTEVSSISTVEDVLPIETLDDAWSIDSPVDLVDHVTDVVSASNLEITTPALDEEPALKSSCALSPSQEVLLSLPECKVECTTENEPAQVVDDKPVKKFGRRNKRRQEV